MGPLLYVMVNVLITLGAEAEQDEKKPDLSATFNEIGICDLVISFNLPTCGYHFQLKMPF